MPFAATLFDLDGTLVNTIPDLTDATNAMRLEMGFAPLSQDVIATYVGKGLENLVVRALTGELSDPPEGPVVQHGLRVFRTCYHALNGDKSVLYPEALEGLKAFRKQGMPLGIVTNKSAEFTHPLLQRMGIASFFDHVVSGDTCAYKKPHPLPVQHACELLGADPRKTLLIGDSINDVAAARAAGCTVVVVPYGYNEGHTVQNLDADAIVADVNSAALWALRH